MYFKKCRHLFTTTVYVFNYNYSTTCPCAFAYYIKCSFDDTLNRLRVYKGIDSPTKFVLALSEDIKDLYNNVLMRPKSMFPLNDVEKKIQSE
jgi:hypothetical protein